MLSRSLPVFLRRASEVLYCHATVNYLHSHTFCLSLFLFFHTLMKLVFMSTVAAAITRHKHTTTHRSYLLFYISHLFIQSAHSQLAQKQDRTCLTRQSRHVISRSNTKQSQPHGLTYSLPVSPLLPGSMSLTE